METKALVLAAYEEEDLIGRTCESLLNQTIDFDQFVLVDSGSSDGTVEIASNYVDRVIQAPRGKVQARDRGIREVSSDTVFAADGDRFYPPDWGEKLYRHFRDPEVVGVTGIQLFQSTDKEGELFEKIGNFFVNPFFRGAMELATGALPGGLNGGSSAIKRDAFLEVGGFKHPDPEDGFGRWIEEEYMFRKRLEQVGTVRFEPDAVALEPPRRIRSWLDPSKGGYSKMVRTGDKI